VPRKLEHIQIRESLGTTRSVGELAPGVSLALEDGRISESLLLAVFALSGVAALTYQVCWQRLLFSAFGVDTESVTIIVSTFMLGLGCGALLGGKLADRYNDRIIELFIASELGIALFGFFSSGVIALVGDSFVDASLPMIAIVNFLLILLPTTLMGATLPMLVAHLFRRSANVGVSIGGLYLVNTLGAAAGALATGIVLFIYLTLDQAIYIAVCCNLMVATLTFLGLSRKTQG
jgi:predicted membrane-bound spermidine synthase